MPDDSYFYVAGQQDGYEDAQQELLALLSKRPENILGTHHEARYIVMLTWLGVDTELHPILGP
jgi:hypothetical protein